MKRYVKCLGYVLGLMVANSAYATEESLNLNPDLTAYSDDLPASAAYYTDSTQQASVYGEDLVEAVYDPSNPSYTAMPILIDEATTTGNTLDQRKTSARQNAPAGTASRGIVLQGVVDINGVVVPRATTSTKSGVRRAGFER